MKLFNHSVMITVHVKLSKNDQVLSYSAQGSQQPWHVEHNVLVV